MFGIEPLFSVVIATHGRAHLLAQLLDSLDRSRAAGDTTAEFLVVDSTKGAEKALIRDVCDRVGAVLIDGPLSTCRKQNMGARSARGAWLLFIDSSCEASHDLFQAYRSTLEERLDLCVAAGPTVFREAESWLTQTIIASSLFPLLRQPSTSMRTALRVNSSNLLVRKDAFTNIGGFRDDLKSRFDSDDFDLCLRLRDHGYRVAVVPGAVCSRSLDAWTRSHSIVWRSFRLGWMNARLICEHPSYRRLDAPGLAVHLIACLALAVSGAVVEGWRLLLMPVMFVMSSVILNVIFALASDSSPREALLACSSLILVRLPFGLGRAIGSLSRGSLFGILYRLDADDDVMSEGFSNIVGSLWSDHLSFLVSICFCGWFI